ncbi:hypothetical protein H6S82_05510 [Planktothrix sp. FACHB-1355]|uniref:Uncharacterized protein n=1 Tax=Aerosakkonema funiforme FACHB-1375 TaxID=2949571 RepID=A0A926VB44_9CYAN|nr:MULTISPECIES: hypothetical protein [Oscillatoriales]MBD2180616.1 hypothetical protein [Aerosakkonema funiforme FACHB-1375]MBD3558313.1 hypothetical protein [Planktothrix sp. FACHB-1355]
MPKTYVAEFAEYWLERKKPFTPSSREGENYLVSDCITFIKIVLSAKFKSAGVEFKYSNSALKHWMYSGAPDWAIVMLKEIDIVWKREWEKERYRYPENGDFPPRGISTRASYGNSTETKKAGSNLYQNRTRW